MVGCTTLNAILEIEGKKIHLISAFRKSALARCCLTSRNNNSWLLARLSMRRTTVHLARK
jgi:hypothetical protein